MIEIGENLAMTLQALGFVIMGIALIYFITKD